ncbi:hypothetical protein ACKWTF_015917 [Chironomus riparius]
MRKELFGLVLSLVLQITSSGGPLAPALLCKTYIKDANVILHSLEEALTSSLDAFAENIYFHEFGHPSQSAETFMTAVTPMLAQANSSILNSFTEAKTKVATHFGLAYEDVNNLFSDLNNLSFPFSCIEFILKKMRGASNATLNQTALTLKILKNFHA